MHFEFTGQWLCRTCSMGKKPDCVLCPNKGGAMKSTRSGTKWAHVSCALWIPEVSIGSVDRMEPITKISNIPTSRWALNCILCRERVGACIQCSVKTCKTAYHVTCAFQHGLEMRAIIEDEHNEDGVKLRSYCQKHSNTKGNNNKKESTSGNNKISASTGSGTDDEDIKKRRIRKEMTSEERNHARAVRLAEIESEFDKHVNIKDISCHLLDIDQDGINYIYNYWILKRKSGSNRPLLPPKSEDAELASQKEENQEHEKMRMFVQLRQDLERVRNLCYMVSRREKLSRSFFKLREQTFSKQIGLLSEIKFVKKLDDSVLNAVMEANHGPSIYDKLYSSDSVEYNDNEVVNNIDVIVDRLLSSSNLRYKSPKQGIDLGSNSSLDKIKLSPNKSRQPVDINGINNNKKNLDNKSSNASGTAEAKQSILLNNKIDNPYKRTYFNGTSTSRRSASLYSSTGLSSDSDENRSRRLLQDGISASSEEEEGQALSSSTNKKVVTVPPKTTTNKTKQSSNKASPRQRMQNIKTVERKRRRDAKSEQIIKSKSIGNIDSSSEDDENRYHSRKSPRNRTLQQMEEELANELNSTDSEELTGICYKPNSFSNTKVSTIYSDSDSTDKDKTDNTASDSQQFSFRTKAAMKEFNLNASNNEKSNKAVKPITANLKANMTLPKSILKNAEKYSKNATETIQEDTNNSKKIKPIEKGAEKIVCKNDFPADLLVVPQRQAAKKASENLMRANTISTVVQQPLTNISTNYKKETKVETDCINQSRIQGEESDKKSDRKGSKAAQVKTLKRQESKDALPDKEKDASSIDLSPYVPQRQAAKKAAQHIKTAVLKPSEAVVVAQSPSQPLPELQKSNTKVTRTGKKEENAKKHTTDSSSTGSGSSSSSGSSSASDSGSSSSSSEDSEPEVQKISQKRHSITSKNSAIRNSGTVDSKTKDLPFLDKGTKSTGTIFCSSDSNSDTENTNDESDTSNKRIPAKITKRTSSSAATSTSLKSSSSGVGASAGTNTSSGTGRPRGRPRTKSISAEDGIKKSKSHKQSGSTSKEPYQRTSSNQKDESKSRRQSVTNVQTKATARGRRDSKVQVRENATASTKRRTSNDSTKIMPEATDLQTRRKSTTTRRESIKDTSKNETLPTATVSNVSFSKKRKETSDNITTASTRKSRLSILEEKDTPTEQKAASKEKNNAEKRGSSSSSTNKEDDKTSVISPTECEKAKTILESVQLMKRITPIKEYEPLISKNIKEMTPERVKTPETVSDKVKDQCNERKTPVVEPISIETKSNRNSSDMEIEPPLSPIHNNIPPDENLSTFTSVAVTTNKNNGPKSIFDLTDDLADTNEPHFEVPPTPLTFTSHQNDWLKADSIEDTEQATLDLVEKLRQNKHKKQSQSDSVSSDNLEQDSKELPSGNLADLKIDTTLEVTQNSAYVNDNIPDMQKRITDDIQNVFDRPSSKIDNDKKDDQSETKGIISQINEDTKRALPETNIDSSIDPAHSKQLFIQDSCSYERRWNESEIIARRRSVSSSPASTVSDNNENQHLVNVNATYPNILSSVPLKNKQPNLNQSVFSIQSEAPKINTSEDHSPLKHQQDESHLQKSLHNHLVPQSQPNLMPFPQNDLQQQRSFKPDFLQSFDYPSFPVVGREDNFYQNRVPLGKKGDDMKSIPTDSFYVPNTTPFNMQMEQNLQQTTPITSTHFPNTQEKMNLSIDNSNQLSNSIQNQPFNVQDMSTLHHTEINDSINVCKVEVDKRKPSTMPQIELKKSPVKPNRNNRSSQQNIENVQAQVRSPLAIKSPCKSPRQIETNRQANTTTTTSKSNVKTINEGLNKQRSRSNSVKNTGQINRNRNSGNKKCRGRNVMPFNDFDFGGTNHSNLAGTAYDLDLVEEENNFTLENFRTSLLRDRKKSNDISTLDYLRSRDPSQSPKFSSPKNRSIYSSAANTPTAGSTPTGNTPMHQVHHHPLIASDVNASVSTIQPTTSVPTSLHDIVLPVLPGPVDMRTYSSTFDSTNNELYNNHLLGAFDSGAADHTLADIDEEMEKELQSALKASNSKPTEPLHIIENKSESTLKETQSNTSNTLTSSNTISNLVVEPPSEEVSVDSDTMKVTVPDSRNQLKLKIKGPLAPDSYSSCITIQKSIETSVSLSTAVQPAVQQGLRRMRKKELLRQYWTQDANLDDQTSVSVGETNPSFPPYSIPNRVTGIPKAVDSMSSIPTKEDYKDYNTNDTKKRKKVTGLQRELRQLSGSLEEEILERRRSLGNASDKSSNASNSGRIRLNRSVATLGQTPKLKIKIGSDIIGPTAIITNDEPRQSDKPPKKRLDNMVNYSMEDLKRDSLNYRKQMFADFGKKEKQAERHEKTSTEKKKKKKEKKRKVEVIESNQKFVLKIKKHKMEETAITEIIKPGTPVTFDPNAEDPLKIDLAPKKSAPLKLKLARTSGVDGVYTLASKKEKHAKKGVKKTSDSSQHKKGDDVQQQPKREFRLQIPKLDQDTIRKLSSNPNNSNDDNTKKKDTLNFHGDKDESVRDVFCDKDQNNSENNRDESLSTNKNDDSVKQNLLDPLNKGAEVR